METWNPEKPEPHVVDPVLAVATDEAVVNKEADLFQAASREVTETQKYDADVDGHHGYVTYDQYHHHFGLLQRERSDAAKEYYRKILGLPSRSQVAHPAAQAWAKRWWGLVELVTKEPSRRVQFFAHILARFGVRTEHVATFASYVDVNEQALSQAVERSVRTAKRPTTVSTAFGFLYLGQLFERGVPPEGLTYKSGIKKRRLLPGELQVVLRVLDREIRKRKGSARLSHNYFLSLRSQFKKKFHRSLDRQKLLQIIHALEHLGFIKVRRTRAKKADGRYCSPIYEWGDKPCKLPWGNKEPTNKPETL